MQRGATINPEIHHDVSIPLRDMTPARHIPGQLVRDLMPIPRPHHAAPVTDPVLQSSSLQSFAPALLTNYLGIGNGLAGFTVQSAPPDPNGDVGPNHYVQTVNSDFAVFNKATGAVMFGPVALNTLWSGFGGGCQTNNDGDPIVLYDPIADRWIISQFSVSTTPYLQCVAVSTTPDPTGTYNRYSFNYGNTDFPDYPKMGVWPDAYYVTFNIFANGQTFGGAKICAFDRAKMLAGQAATQQCFANTSTSFGGVLPADMDGHSQPPAGSPNYLVALGASANQLAYWKAHVDWTTPANSSLTGPTTLTTAAYVEASSIPQPGTTNRLDSLSDRLMHRLAYRNFGDHEALVVNHSITAGSSTGVRWYELRPDTSHNLSIFQQGTYAPDTTSRWMGSIAMDQSGNIGLGFSVSSSTLSPGIRYTGRLAGDASGTMAQGENTIIIGPGIQTGNLTRWGDYSAMAIDPSDDCTFWYTNEYIPANGAFNWSTRIGSFKLPNCGPAPPPNDFSIAANPTSLTIAQGASDTSTISTAITSGSVQTITLSASGVPSGASASFNPTSVTAGSSSSLTINAGTAAPGTYSVTVTGTAASGSHTTTVSLTVTAPPNDFSIAANPTSLTLVQGTSNTSTISTAITSGSAETVSLSVSGLPTGASAGFNPTSVTSGNSSTLTMNAGTAAPGTYTLTVTGTAASGSHATTVSLTVTAPADDFSIAANPTSLTIVQGASNTSTISTAITSGSAETVSLSVSGLPTGASAGFNPTSVTSGNSSTLTVNAGTAAPGTYTLTVTGTAASGSHATTISLTVTPSTSQTLNVIFRGSGAGAVSSVPAGIACPSTCTAAFPTGTSVTLTANPAAGSVFNGWSGACSGLGSCTVTMNTGTTVTAAFAKAKKH